jgi:putative flippase GtrA
MKIDNKALIRQVLLYGVIGGISASLDYLLFTLLYETAGMNELIANVFSVHAGITISFILNRRYNFKKIDRVAFRAISFYLTGLFGLALSELLLWGSGRMMLPIMIVKLVSIFIVAAVQFAINRLVTFRK